MYALRVKKQSLLASAPHRPGQAILHHGAAGKYSRVEYKQATAVWRGGREREKQQEGKTVERRG